MLDASNYDARPLRLRINDRLSHPSWKSATEISRELNVAFYTVSAMMSKMFLYGAPWERKQSERRSNEFVYRLKPETRR